MITAPQIRLKIDKWPLWNKIKTFDREIIIQHKQIPTHVSTADKNYQGYLVILFLNYWFPKF